MASASVSWALRDSRRTQRPNATSGITISGIASSTRPESLGLVITIIAVAPTNSIRSAPKICVGFSRSHEIGILTTSAAALIAAADAFAAVKKDRIIQAAKKYFNDANKTVGRLIPEGGAK